MARTITKECANCRAVFEAALREHKRGNGRFCSMHCNAVNAARSRVRPSVIVRCATCDAELRRPPSRVRNARSPVFFCSKSCKTRFQWTTERRPHHYTTGIPTYRERALAAYPARCSRCGWERLPAILEVHHRDRDRENNAVDNLEILCRNCHGEEHYRHGDGRHWRTGTARRRRPAPPP